MTESKALELLKNNEERRTAGIYIKVKHLSILALEKQIEMKKYCDEQGCANCPYHNSSLKDNRCMNDFIIEKE